MLKEIAKITGLPFDEANPLSQERLRRISMKLPRDGFIPSLDNKQFVKMVLAAEEAVNKEGLLAIQSMVAQLAAPPAEKKFKIKRSPKGARIKVAAANGVRFSFGPVWNESVAKGKGIATAEANREKLNHQALLAGIADPEKMDVKALCAAIAATF